MRFFNPKYLFGMTLFGCIILLIDVYPSAHADSAETPASAERLSSKGQILSLEKISAIAKKYKSGEILEVELERKQGKYVYEVDILDQGSQVWELKLDARSGQLLKMEQDD